MIIQNTRLLLFVFVFLSSVSAGICTAQKLIIPENEIIQDVRDSVIFNNLVNKFSEKKNLPIGELIIIIGKSFKGMPYVAHTLEKGSEEKLVVNLREMDCTTFAENCLAIARTIQSDNPVYSNFLEKLQQIRYRNGIRDQYPSRLHYFSDWLYNNTEKNIISMPTTSVTEAFPNKVYFMSKHPDSYPCLNENPKFIALLNKQEEAISARSYYYIPKEKIEEAEGQLNEGDIVGITTNIGGLDIVHTILLTKVNGRVHLLHASSSAKKVILSDVPLADYLAKSKIQTGIILGRPK